MVVTVFCTCHLTGVTSAPVPVQRAVEKDPAAGMRRCTLSARGRPRPSVRLGSQPLLSQLDATVFEFASLSAIEYHLGGRCGADDVLRDGQPGFRCGGEHGAGPGDAVGVGWGWVEQHGDLTSGREGLAYRGEHLARC
jgi:hypothetical protein